MRNGLIAALIAIFSLSIYGQDLRIVETGSFHGEEVDVNNGEIWLGLFKRGESYMLMPAILSVETVYDAVIDAEGEATGTSIKVPGMGEPSFLIKGNGFEQAMPVITLDLSGSEIGSGFDKNFTFNGLKYRLRVESSKENQDEFIGNDSQLILSDGVVEQTLYTAGECSFCRWRVDWAGDMDADGKPDFYLYLTDHYNVANQKLFLSSKAESGRLVKEVAEFITTGC